MTNGRRDLTFKCKLIFYIINNVISIAFKSQRQLKKYIEFKQFKKPIVSFKQ